MALAAVRNISTGLEIRRVDRHEPNLIAVEEKDPPYLIKAPEDGWQALTTPDHVIGTVDEEHGDSDIVTNLSDGPIADRLVYHVQPQSRHVDLSRLEYELLHLTKRPIEHYDESRKESLKHLIFSFYHVDSLNGNDYVGILMRLNKLLGINGKKLHVAHTEKNTYNALHLSGLTRHFSIHGPLKDAIRSAIFPSNIGNLMFEKKSA